ncbi:hypothetical protein DICPUDRAFT_79212 [Dictyostelium purpureum]|uniref:Transmembrane protein n=1 Tax=Dictyostelium purpureum TaxID=5786 RepID=F0ZLW8_DICPU|nr:uncharacterized protein DICPUDRAFT_79212 [Dictyostelium purpureum]EGC35039.1 hypothetical protein DICPUDRAFT_79212 [Dictyostelium purpureum]|eukprot:XP_003288407.1 hypothetical protein DICPUDRAFT_79212 [Dictyostelium purpureum]
MGIIFSKKNNAIEDFLGLETKISNLESKIKNKEEIHYRITLSDDTLFVKTLCYLFSAVIPFIIYILWVSFKFIFGTVTEDYQNELKELNICMEILLEDKNLQAELNSKKNLQIFERVLKKSRAQQQQQEELQQQQPEEVQQEKPKIPQILIQWASKEIEPKENNSILGELKAINIHLSNFVVLRSLETNQLDLFLANIINCAIHFENVSDDVKTISSLIVSKVIAQAHFDSNISQDHIYMIESYILELYKIINKYTKYRYHQIEGVICVFKHFAKSLQNNQFNIIIKDMFLIHLVWSSALNLFEDLEYLELKQEFRQLYNDTYCIVSNYFIFTSDTIRSENLLRFNNSINNFWDSNNRNLTSLIDIKYYCKVCPYEFNSKTSLLSKIPEIICPQSSFVNQSEAPYSSIFKQLINLNFQSNQLFDEYQICSGQTNMVDSQLVLDEKI